MAITINWATRVISIPQSDLTHISGSLYELDLNAFRLSLKNLEDGEDGMAFPATHVHTTQVSVAGITLARVVEIINGYTITFQDGQYAVRLVGANSNVADVVNVNQVSVRSNNSAGLIVTENTSPTSSEIAAAVWAYVAEGSTTMLQFMRRIASALFGTTTGVGTSTEVFKSMDGSKERIKMRYDVNGNRQNPNFDDS